MIWFISSILIKYFHGRVKRYYKIKIIVTPLFLLMKINSKHGTFDLLTTSISTLGKLNGVVLIERHTMNK